MSLDLTILGDDGHPVRWVPISVTAHTDLMDLSDQLGLPLLGRMSDYYGDAIITLEELPAFLNEIEKIKTALNTDSSLQPLLTDFQELTEEAMRSHRSLEAIAD